jgi:hypothetical protein
MNNGEKIRGLALTLIWLVFAWAVVVYSLHPIHDGDTWWHLAEGRAMVERHQLLRSDIFSHTLHGAPWINFEWATEIGAYLTVKLFGLRGLIFLKAGLGLIALTLLVRLLMIMGARSIVLFLLTWLGYHVLQVRLCTRVELLSFIFMPALLLLIKRARAGIFSKWIPLFTFALFVVWANTHGGFAYGLVLLGCFAVGSRWANDAVARTAVIDRMFVVALLGSLINPWGPTLFTVFLQHAVDFGQGPNVLAEWEAPTVIAAPAFWTCYALGAISIAWALLKKKRDHYAWIPATLIFALIGSRYLRTTSYLAFVALPFAAGFLKHTRIKPAVQFALLALCLGLLEIERPFLRIPHTLPTVEKITVPEGGVAFLDANHIDGTLFNTYGYGGYIEWASGTGRPVFMDGRYIFYPLVEQYENVMLGRGQEINVANWARYFNEFGIDHALVKYEPLRLHRAWNFPVKHESAMNVMFPKKDWALVYWDDACLVFLKRIPKFDRLIAADEYKNARPYDLPAVINTVSEKPESALGIEQDLERNAREVGPTWRAAQIRALLNRAN